MIIQGIVSIEKLKQNAWNAQKHFAKPVVFAVGERDRGLRFRVLCKGPVEFGGFTPRIRAQNLLSYSILCPSEYRPMAWVSWVHFRSQQKCFAFQKVCHFFFAVFQVGWLGGALVQLGFPLQIRSNVVGAPWNHLGFHLSLCSSILKVFAQEVAESLPATPFGS